MKTDEGSLLSPCPLCHGERIRAQLKAPGFGNYVFVSLCDESLPEESDLLCLDVWLCTACGVR